MRKLGIIGGTSWSSTALYYDHINRGVSRRLGGLHSALMAIESLDLGPLAKMELSGDWNGVARVMAKAGKLLEAGGADGLLIASNTGHKVYDQVASAISIPILHIADSTAEELAADGRVRVALLGTRFMMSEPFIRERIERRDITLMPVDVDWAREVDRIIFDELAAGRATKDSQRKLRSLITELAKKKVEAVVLGCTELVLAVDVRTNVIPIYDTTAIHARAAVKWMLADQEEARAAA